MNTNHLINQLGEHMQEDLTSALAEREAEILSAIAKLCDDNEDDAPVKFSVTLKGVLNLDKNTVSTTFGFTVKTTVKGEHQVEEPMRATLPIA